MAEAKKPEFKKPEAKKPAGSSGGGFLVALVLLPFLAIPFGLFAVSPAQVDSAPARSEAPASGGPSAGHDATRVVDSKKVVCDILHDLHTIGLGCGKVRFRAANEKPQLYAQFSPLDILVSILSRGTRSANAAAPKNARLLPAHGRYEGPGIEQRLK